MVNPGTLNITWNLTAQHRTSTWDYYITKPTWNPNQPLKFSDFELITKIDDKATVPPKQSTKRSHFRRIEKDIM